MPEPKTTDAIAIQIPAQHLRILSKHVLHNL